VGKEDKNSLKKKIHKNFCNQRKIHKIFKIYLSNQNICVMNSLNLIIFSKKYVLY